MLPNNVTSPDAASLLWLHSAGHVRGPGEFCRYTARRMVRKAIRFHAGGNESMNRRALVLGFLLLVAPTALQAQFNYRVNSDLTITITGYTGPGGNVTIPSTINGMPVTTIGNDTFVVAGLTGIFIPVGVTNIGVEASLPQMMARPARPTSRTTLCAAT